MHILPVKIGTKIHRIETSIKPARYKTLQQHNRTENALSDAPHKPDKRT